MSADERTDVMMRSWEVVDRFFDYLVNSKQPLSGPERPLL